MRWKGRRQSSNVEDRRFSSRGPIAAGGGGLAVVAILVIALCMGADPSDLLNIAQQANVGQGGVVENGGGEAPPENDEQAEFVSVVLADTEDVWRELFQQHGIRYQEPQLVLFRGQADTACGFQSAAVGPFYCPGDQTIFIDLSFYEDMKNDLGAPGDFAQAYVIAHEVGHHVQKMIGTSEDVSSRQRRVSKEESNQLSVRLELQADFYAGVWAHHAQKRWQILEPGDINEAINAATAIGDDRLQKRSRGYVVPETFTHGTSAQRVRWFRKGFETGDMLQGDTFKPPYDQL